MPLSSNMIPDPNREVKKVTPSVEDLQKIQECLKIANEVTQSLKPSNKKRRGVSSLTLMPYYKERFALEFKMWVDEMMAEFDRGELLDRLFAYSDFPSLSHNTLYIKVNQSKLYLLDQLDPDGKYKRFLQLVSITRDRGVGVRISYNRDLDKESSFMPSVVMPKEHSYTWKARVEKFLEEATDGQEITISRLALTHENIMDLKTSLVQLEDLLYKITTSSIWLKKLSHEEYVKLIS